MGRYTQHAKKRHLSPNQQWAKRYGGGENPKTAAQLFAGFSERLARMGHASYESYLASAHWAEVKERFVHSKRRKACARCGNTDYQLHHRTYKRLGVELLEDLIALCAACHLAEHQRLRT